MKKLFIAIICYLPPVRISGPGYVAAAGPLFHAWAPAQNLHSLCRAQQGWLSLYPRLTSPSSGSIRAIPRSKADLNGKSSSPD